MFNFGLGNLFKTVFVNWWAKPKNKETPTTKTLLPKELDGIEGFPPIEQITLASKALAHKLGPTTETSKSPYEHVLKILDEMSKHLSKNELMLAEYKAKNILRVLFSEESKEIIKKIISAIDLLSPKITLLGGEFREIKYREPVKIGSSLWITEIRDIPPLREKVKQLDISFDLALLINPDMKIYYIFDTGSFTSSTSIRKGEKALIFGEFIYLGPNYLFSGEPGPNSPMSQIKGNPIPDRLIKDRFSNDSYGEGNLAIIVSKDSFFMYKPRKSPEGEFYNAKPPLQGKSIIVLKEYNPFTKTDKERIVSELAIKMIEGIN